MSRTESASILVVDDDRSLRFAVRCLLEDEGYAVREAPDGQRAIAALGEQSADLMITDLRMPVLGGMDLLAEAERLPDAPPIVVITAHGSEKHAVQAMKLGAFDYLKKPFDNDEILAVVRRAVAHGRLRAERSQLRSELHLARSLLFVSEAMGQVAARIARVGPRNVNVLITGESGTGKERVADAIVGASPRANKPFLRFNCAALPAALVEAELFGHARGAFTGAVRQRAGLFREADGGTLLLDEVGDLDRAAQAKLLRVLQEGEVRPVGEDKPVRVDVRILAATHKDLGALAQQGAFRDDLRYRLTVVQIHVPPLRERPDDIPLLARHFFDRAAERFGTGPLRVRPEVFHCLAAEPWPGNVRQLEHTIDSLVALSEDGIVDEAALAAQKAPRAASKAPSAEQGTLRAQVDAFEKSLLLSALDAAGGNKSEAARRLGLSRATLHEKLTKHGI